MLHVSKLISMQAKFVTVKFQLESKSKGGKSKSGYSRVPRGLVTKKGQVFCTEDSVVVRMGVTDLHFD